MLFVHRIEYLFIGFLNSLRPRNRFKLCTFRDHFKTETMKKLLLSTFLAFSAFFAQAQTYCTPAYSTGCAIGDDIDDVYIGTFQDTNTGCSTGHYMVSTSDTIDMQQSAYTTVELTSNYSTQWFAIWIDVNEDGDFDDANEHQWSSTTNQWSGNVDSVMISPSIPLGTYRMRIRSNFSGQITAAQSCSSLTYGEVHDYTVRITTPPACPVPFFSGVSTTDSTATVTWASNDSAFTVEYGVSGFSTGSGLTVSATDTFATLSNLSPNTVYDFYITTNCTAAGNGYSGTVGPYSFKTLCVPVSTPLYENFDNDSIGSFSDPNAPSCWYYLEENGANGSGFINDAIWSLFPQSGTQYYELYSSSDSLMEMLVSPSVLGLDSGMKEVEFYAATTGFSGAEIIVGSLSNPADASTFAPIDTFSVPSGATWTKFTSYMYASRGYNLSDLHIAFATSPNSSFTTVYLEDVTVQDGPACIPPTSLNVSNIGVDSAQVSFAATGIAYYLEYGGPGFVPSFTQGTGTLVNVSGSPAWLTGLDSNTTYDVYVYHMCADSTISPAFGPVSFKTLTCAPSSMCTIDLELVDSFGDGWNGAEVQVVNASGGVEFTLGSDFTTGTSYTYTISLCVGGNYSVVVLDAGSYPSEIGIKVISSGSTIATYTPTIGTVAGTSMATFASNCNTLCPTPSDLVATPTTNSASFTFNTNGNTGTFNFYAGPQGWSQGTGSVATYTGSTTTGSFTMNGLSSGTCYDVLLIADCGANGVSDTLGPITFCTALCDPSDLCTYTAYLYDSFGDGWNGATLTYSINGIASNDFLTFTDGYGDTLSIQVCSGSFIEFINGSAGIYPSEVSYDVQDASGNSVASVAQGSFSANASGGSHIANCISTSCAVPTSVTASVTGVSATVTWSGSGTSYLYKYKAQGTTNMLNSTSSTASATLSSLAPSTTYAFYVAQVCSSGDTSNYMYSEFTTDPCATVVMGTPSSSVNNVTSNYAEVNFDWSSSSNYSSYFIDFGDGNSNSGSSSSTVHQYTANGGYTATLSLYGQCDTATQTISVSIAGIGMEENIGLNALTLFPNPTSGLVNLAAYVDGTTTLGIRVINYLGSTVYQGSYEAMAGQFSQSLDLSAQAAGAYVIEIQTERGMIQKTIILRH